MTTNKPEVVAWQTRDDLVYEREAEVSLMRVTGEKSEPLIRLSDHEVVVSELRSLLQRCEPVMVAHAGASHMTEGFRTRRNKWDELVERIEAVLEGDT